MKMNQDYVLSRMFSNIKPMKAEDMELNNLGDLRSSRTVHFVLKNFLVVDPNNGVISACLEQ